MKRVQSFGAGVQSVALLRMAVEGRFEKPDLCIFSDTGAEPEHVYEVVEREKRIAERAGIEFVTVHWRDLSQPQTSAAGNVMLFAPLFTRTTEGRWIDMDDDDKGLVQRFFEFFGGPKAKVWVPPGEEGQLLRNCTDRFKIQPIRRELRARGWKGEGCEMWLGMTTDEIQRVKPSRVNWIEHRWPLVEQNLRRSDCIAYLNRLGLEAAKSACFMCPYRSSVQWLEVKAVPRDWELAVRYDRAIRHARPGYLTFVHPSRIPLDEVSFDNERQVSLWDAECDGICAA